MCVFLTNRQMDPSANVDTTDSDEDQLDRVYIMATHKYIKQPSRYHIHATRGKQCVEFFTKSSCPSEEVIGASPRKKNTSKDPSSNGSGGGGILSSRYHPSSSSSTHFSSRMNATPRTEGAAEAAQLLLRYNGSHSTSSRAVSSDRLNNATGYRFDYSNFRTAETPDRVKEQSGQWVRRQAGLLLYR